MDFFVFEFGSISSCFFTGHHWEEPSCRLYSGPIRYLTLSYSLTFSRLNSPRSLSLSLNDRNSSPLIISVSICWTSFSMCMSVLCWRAQTRTQHSRCVSSVLRRGKDQLPPPAGNAFPNAAQSAVGLLCHKYVLLAHIQLVHEDPQVCLCTVVF